jgi:hypothetical protein
MSTTTPWILEPESGRYYINWDDGYGRTIRRYGDGPDGSVDAPSKPTQSVREDFLLTSTTSKNPLDISHASRTTLRQDDGSRTTCESTTSRRELPPSVFVQDGYGNNSRVPHEPPTSNAQESLISTSRDHQDEEYEFVGESETDEKTDIDRIGGGDKAELDSGLRTVANQSRC